MEMMRQHPLLFRMILFGNPVSTENPLTLSWKPCCTSSRVPRHFVLVRATAFFVIYRRDFEGAKESRAWLSVLFASEE